MAAGLHEFAWPSAAGRTGLDVRGRAESTMVTSAQDRGEGQGDIRHVILRNVIWLPASVD